MGLKKKNYNGFTPTTTENIQLDAGAFFKNFTVGTDTYATAKTAGKLIGATQGGGEFSAKPTITQVSIDGVETRTKGVAVIDSWETYIKATVIETTVDTMKLALASVTTDATTTANYTEIEGSANISDNDYIENITWIGHISGYVDPVIIQVYNALNEGGLTYAVTDKGQGKIALQFYGYNAVSDVSGAEKPAPPFKIFYPTPAQE